MIVFIAPLTGVDAPPPTSVVGAPYVGGVRRQPIAVLEDDFVLREAICGILRDEGYETHAATTLPNARKILELVRPSAVILDLFLGDDDASAILDEMDARGMQIPAVIISAHPRLSAHAERPRCTIMRKPFNLEHLVEELRAALAVRH